MNNQDLSKWNGKFYGSDKSGYRVYINKVEIKISEQDKLELEQYLKDKELLQDEANTKLTTTKIIDYIKSKTFKEENIDMIDETLINRIIHNIVKIQHNLINTEKHQINRIRTDHSDNLKQYLNCDISSNSELVYFPNNCEKELIDLGYRSIVTNIKGYEKIILDYLNFSKSLTPEFIENIKSKLRAGFDLSKQIDNIIDKYGRGSWNGKVYGGVGSYIIYLNSRKIEISDEDANILKSDI